MTAPKRQWGGSRSGSGKKPSVAGAPATAPVTVKLTDEQKAKFQRLGGASWVRQKIDAEPDPSPGKKE